MAEIEFTELAEGNAHAFFEAYIGRKDAVLADFTRTIADSGGPSLKELDYSPQSLVPLWVWIRPRLESAARLLDPQRDSRNPVLASVFPPAHPPTPPMWYAVEVSHNESWEGVAFTAETARRVDGLGYYLGDVYARHLPGRWGVCKTKLDDVTEMLFGAYLRPVVIGCRGYFAPIGESVGLAVTAQRGLDADDRLLKTFETDHSLS